MLKKNQNNSDLKFCKNCNILCTEENTTRSQLQRTNSICKKCKKIKNSNRKRFNETPKDINNRPHKFKRLQEQTDHITYTDTFNEQYITEWTLQDLNIKKETLFFSSNMGTGKTRAIIHIMEKFTDQKIIYCTVNKETINDTTRQMRNQGLLYVKDFCTYKDYKDYKARIVLTTVDSLLKLNTIPDILILDEATSIFEDIPFKSMTDNDKMIKDKKYRVYGFIRNHPCVMLFDSNLMDIDKIIEPKRYIRNLYKKSKDIRIVQEYKDFIFEIKYFIKNNPEAEISVQVDNTKILKSIKDNLIRTGFIQEENVSLWTANDKNNIDDFNSKKYKFSSPKISRGVSIKGDFVFIKDDGKANLYTIYQMVDRARESKVITLMLSETSCINGYKTIINRYVADMKLDDGLYRFALIREKRVQKRQEFIKLLLGVTYKIIDYDELYDTSAIEENRFQRLISDINFEDINVVYRGGTDKVRRLIIRDLIKKGYTFKLNELLEL